MGKIKEKLFADVLWTTSFCFEDIYNCATDEFRDRVDAMSDDEFEEFFYMNDHG